MTFPYSQLYIDKVNFLRNISKSTKNYISILAFWHSGVFLSTPHCQPGSGSAQPDSDTYRGDENITYDEPNDGANKQNYNQGGSANPVEKEWLPNSRYKKKVKHMKKTTY